jgi:hypothetical protein
MPPPKPGRFNLNTPAGKMRTPPAGRRLTQIQCKLADRNSVIGRRHVTGRLNDRDRGSGFEHYVLQLDEVDGGAAQDDVHTGRKVEPAGPTFGPELIEAE